MNLEQLKEMQQDISKRVNVNLAKYDDRQIAYEYYINELDKFLKASSSKLIMSSCSSKNCFSESSEEESLMPE